MARVRRFSALQRAEIAEIVCSRLAAVLTDGFSALQRAEIAEISVFPADIGKELTVSVLFNEPKLLKCRCARLLCEREQLVSVLFNEPKLLKS